MTHLIRCDPYRKMLSWKRTMRRMMRDFYDRDELGFGEPVNFCMAMDVIENAD